MFSEECIQTIFSNIEEIYNFEKDFFAELEAAVDENSIHRSDIASIFLKNVS